MSAAESVEAKRKAFAGRLNEAALRLRVAAEVRGGASPMICRAVRVYRIRFVPAAPPDSRRTGAAAAAARDWLR